MAGSKLFAWFDAIATRRRGVAGFTALLARARFFAALAAIFAADVSVVVARGAPVIAALLTRVAVGPVLGVRRGRKSQGDEQGGEDDAGRTVHIEPKGYGTSKRGQALSAPGMNFT